MAKVKVFHYSICQELPLNSIHNFSNHHRLRVFIQKGFTCVSCGLTGTRLIQGKDRGGSLHWDIYSEDLIPLSVDHIIPKSLGGSNDMENLQPMCSPCNSRKGNGSVSIQPSTPSPKGSFVKYTPEFNPVGKEIYRKVKNRFIRLGVVEDIVINPHTQELSGLVTERGKNSYFNLSKRLYIRR